MFIVYTVWKTVVCPWLLADIKCYHYQNYRLSHRVFLVFLFLFNLVFTFTLTTSSRKWVLQFCKLGILDCCSRIFLFQSFTQNWMNTIILIYIIPIPPTSICHCIIAHYNLSLHVIYCTPILCINVLFLYTYSTLNFLYSYFGQITFCHITKWKQSFWCIGHFLVPSAHCNFLLWY